MRLPSRFPKPEAGWKSVKEVEQSWRAERGSEWLEKWQREHPFQRPWAFWELDKCLRHDGGFENGKEILIKRGWLLEFEKHLLEKERFQAFKTKGGETKQ